MRRFSGAFAFVAGAALIIGSTGAAVGQEDPPPEATMAPEASPEAAVVEPSTLEIICFVAGGSKLERMSFDEAPCS